MALTFRIDDRTLRAEQWNRIVGWVVDADDQVIFVTAKSILQRIERHGRILFRADVLRKIRRTRQIVLVMRAPHR